MSKKKIGIFAGSFDPLTNGHYEVVKTALTFFDEVVVAVGRSLSKGQTLFSVDERLAMIEDVFKGMPVRVNGFSGLLVDFAREQKACALVRGLRTEADFSYEMQMAMTNRHLARDLVTLFFPTSAASQYVSSTLVREVAFNGGDISSFVPAVIKGYIARKLG